MGTRPRISRDLLDHITRRLRVLVPRPHWSRVLTALLLALVIGSVGQTPPAQAQNFWVDTIVPLYPKRTICLNETVPYRVQVVTNRRPTPVDPYEMTAVLMKPGVTLSAISSDGSIGNFTTGSFPISPLAASAGTVPDTAEFTFKANNKTGKVLLTFEAKGFESRIRSAQVSVEVKSCDYKVIAVSRWFASRGIAKLDILARTDWARLAQIDPGSYSGRADLYWFSNLKVNVRGCTASSSIENSTVALTGSRKQGILTVGLYYTSTLYKETIPCIPGTGSSEESIKPFDLAVDVPDSGGIATKSQQLRGMPPSVTVVYVKEDKGE